MTRFLAHLQPRAAFLALYISILYSNSLRTKQAQSLHFLLRWGQASLSPEFSTESYSCFVSTCFNNNQSIHIKHFSHKRMKVFPFHCLPCLGAAKVFIIASYGQRGAEVTRVRRAQTRSHTLLMVRDRQYPISGPAIDGWCISPCNPIVKVIITFHVFTQFYRYIVDLCCLVNTLDTGHI